jgi:hypothetical protein
MVVGSGTTTRPSTLKTGWQTDRILEAGEKKLCQYLYKMSSQFVLVPEYGVLVLQCFVYKESATWPPRSASTEVGWRIWSYVQHTSTRLILTFDIYNLINIPPREKESWILKIRPHAGPWCTYNPVLVHVQWPSSWHPVIRRSTKK